MTDSCSRHPVAVAAVALLAGGLLASTASAQTQPDDFTPLRAVLNLKLGPAKASDPLRSGKGSMTFEFTGNRCTEYKMVRHTVVDLQFVAGAVKVVTDVTMVENADGTQLAFTLTDRVNGEVKRQDTAVARKTPQGVVVTSRQLPGGRLQLPADVVFPLRHDRLVNAATRNRKPLVATVYNPEESVSSIERTTYRVGDEVKTPLPKGHPAAVLGDAPRYRVELVRYDKTGKLRVRENMTRYAKNLLTVTDAVFVDTRIKADLASLKLLPQKPCP